MKRLIKSLSIVLFILTAALFNSSVKAETMQVPQWYNLKATLEEPPVVGKSVGLNVELQSIIGDLNNISVKLILPDGWTVDKKQKNVKKIEAGKTEQIKFTVLPKNELSQGSIVVEAVFDIPKTSINNAIDKMTTDKNTAEGLKATVKAWPNPAKRYTDTSFAIFPEESFYPLSGDMWVSYADELSPDKAFKGPVYYIDSLISLHQAQTDVEMFNKLNVLLKTDMTLAVNLTESGIDLNKKRFDYLNGLYVLAVDAWKNQDFQTALDFLELLEKESVELKKSYADYLKIATGNMRALVFWKQGQRRLAEEAFKNTFALNRKHKLQRYILRNLGLLMYSSKDKETAKQMYSLAKNIKSGYTLLDKELELLNK
jgi:tetratricopeptide (TPR) repeat protein